MPDQLNVLVVDDEDDIRDLLHRMLSARYNCFIAGNIVAALDQIKHGSVDIIVSDVNMPGGSGLDLLRRLKDLELDVPVILLTGFGSKEVAIAAIKEGAYDFIEKPIPQTLLMKALHRAEQGILAKKELIKAQLQSQQAERLATIGAMASCIMHELANPLSIIAGSARLLVDQRGVENMAQVAKMAKRILEMTDRSARLMDSMKNLSRRSTGNAEKVALKTLVYDAVNLCSPLLKHKGVSIDHEIPSAAVTICDRVEVSQVLVNLITNACHAIEPLSQRWIRLEYRPNKDLHELRVVDAGTGIEKQVAEKLFEIFHTTKPVGVGTGLGLHTARRIMEQNKGSLIYLNNEPHTTFQILIPAAKGEEKAA